MLFRSSGLVVCLLAWAVVPGEPKRMEDMTLAEIIPLFDALAADMVVYMESCKTFLESTRNRILAKSGEAAKQALIRWIRNLGYDFDNYIHYGEGPMATYC